MVPAKRVARGKKEDCFDHQESWLNPTQLAWRPDADSMANPCDGAGYKHVRVELVVPVVDFNKEVEGVNLSREL